MTALAGRGVVEMWGSGCEAAPVTRFHFEPHRDGWWIDIEVGGIKLWNRAAPSNDARGVVALDITEAARLLDVLLGDRVGATTANFTMTGVGVIRMMLPLATGDRERVVEDARMIPIADALLELIDRAGIATDPLLHPTRMQ